MQNFESFINWFSNIVTVDVFMKILLSYFFIIWVSIIVWVLKDITNRTNSLLLQLVSLSIVVFLTPLWVFLYLLIRPAKTNLERMYKEIDDWLSLVSNILNSSVDSSWNTINCPRCDFEASDDFKFCPKCWLKLKSTCKHCWKLIDSEWKNCPYCGKKTRDESHDEKEKIKEKEEKYSKDFIQKEPLKKTK